MLKISVNLVYCLNAVLRSSRHLAMKTTKIKGHGLMNKFTGSLKRLDCKLPWWRRLMMKVTGRPFLGRVYVAVDVANGEEASVTAQYKNGKVYIIDVKHIQR